MTRLRRFPPGVRHDIRLNHRRDRKRILQRYSRVALQTTCKVASNIWFVALVTLLRADL